MKYYYEEHEQSYQEMKENQIQAWDQYHEPDKYTFDHFMMRPFLEKAMEFVQLQPKQSRVFEYGCGTGAGACFLAERGFTVDAIDISPTAIELAKSMAEARQLAIHYKNQDLLELDRLEQEYDLILDNYCLQSIVTDQDRAKLFAVIRSGLKKSGYYVIATAMFNEDRVYDGDSYYCQDTGMVYDRISLPKKYPDAMFMDTSWWLPTRRHLKAKELREELILAGFSILLQDNGNVICRY